MGVSASVSTVSYEGRKLRLVVEQLWYESGASYVAWKLYSEGGAGQFYGIGPITVTINGTVVYSKAMSSYNGSNTAAFPMAAGSVNGSLSISHSGSKTIPISLEGYVYYDTGSGPYTTTLTLSASGSSGGSSGGEETATPILFVSGGEIGKNCTLSFAPDWEGYLYQISYYSPEGTLLYMKRLSPRSSGKRIEVSFPLVYGLAESISLSGTVQIRLGTYINNYNPLNQVGKDSLWELDIHVVEDDNTRPRILEALFTPSPDPLGGVYLQNKTAVTGSITAEGKYGASIQRVWFRVEGREYGSGEVSSLLAQYGTLPVTAFARDSRGFTSQGEPLTLEVLPYSPPKLKPVPGQNRVTALRCDGEGVPQENGAFLILKARREYSPLVLEGSQKNFCAISWRYKPDTGDTWSAWSMILPQEAAEDSIITQPLLGTLAPRSSYQVELRAADSLGGESTTLLTVYSDRIYWHRHGALGSLGFGKYAEEADVIDIAGDKTLKIRGGLELLGDAHTLILNLCHPVGSVLETADPADPGTYLGGLWIRQEQTESTTKWRRTQ